jgi:pilus assembly protein Flp/PilA
MHLRAARTESRNDELGATAVEYAIIASFIAVVVVAAVALLGTNLSGTFEGFSSRYEECSTGGGC